MIKDFNECGTATFFYRNQLEYAAIPKYYLKDKRISLKAKGLLTIIYTLPEEWNYNMQGLCKITGLSLKQIRTIIKELEDFHYIDREKTKDEKGKFIYKYWIYIEPFIIPDMEECYFGNH